MRSLNILLFCHFFSIPTLSLYLPFNRAELDLPDGELSEEHKKYARPGYCEYSSPYYGRKWWPSGHCNYDIECPKHYKCCSHGRYGFKICKRQYRKYGHHALPTYETDYDEVLEEFRRFREPHSVTESAMARETTTKSGVGTSINEDIKATTKTANIEEKKNSADSFIYLLDVEDQSPNRVQITQSPVSDDFSGSGSGSGHFDEEKDDDIEDLSEFDGNGSGEKEAVTEANVAKTLLELHKEICACPNFEEMKNSSESHVHVPESESSSSSVENQSSSPGITTVDEFSGSGSGSGDFDEETNEIEDVGDREEAKTVDLQQTESTTIIVLSKSVEESKNSSESDLYFPGEENQSIETEISLEFSGSGSGHFDDEKDEKPEGDFEEYSTKENESVTAKNSEEKKNPTVPCKTWDDLSDAVSGSGDFDYEKFDICDNYQDIYEDLKNEHSSKDNNNKSTSATNSEEMKNSTDFYLNPSVSEESLETVTSLEYSGSGSGHFHDAEEDGYGKSEDDEYSNKENEAVTATNSEEMKNSTGLSPEPSAPCNESLTTEANKSKTTKNKTVDDVSDPVSGSFNFEDEEIYHYEDTYYDKDYYEESDIVTEQTTNSPDLQQTVPATNSEEMKNSTGLSPEPSAPCNESLTTEANKSKTTKNKTVDDVSDPVSGSFNYEDTYYDKDYYEESDIVTEQTTSSSDLQQTVPATNSEEMKNSTGLSPEPSAPCNETLTTEANKSQTTKNKTADDVSDPVSGSFNYEDTYYDKDYYEESDIVTEQTTSSSDLQRTVLATNIEEMKNSSETSDISHPEQSEDQLRETGEIPNTTEFNKEKEETGRTTENISSGSATQIHYEERRIEGSSEINSEEAKNSSSSSFSEGSSEGSTLDVDDDDDNGFVGSGSREKEETDQKTQTNFEEMKNSFDSHLHLTETNQESDSTIVQSNEDSSYDSYSESRSGHLMYFEDFEGEDIDF